MNRIRPLSLAAEPFEDRSLPAHGPWSSFAFPEPPRYADAPSHRGPEPGPGGFRPAEEGDRPYVPATTGFVLKARVVDKDGDTRIRLVVPVPGPVRVTPNDSPTAPPTTAVVGATDVRAFAVPPAQGVKVELSSEQAAHEEAAVREERPAFRGPAGEPPVPVRLDVRAGVAPPAAAPTAVQTGTVAPTTGREEAAVPPATGSAAPAAPPAVVAAAGGVGVGTPAPEIDEPPVMPPGDDPTEPPTTAGEPAGWWFPPVVVDAVVAAVLPAAAPVSGVLPFDAAAVEAGAVRLLGKLADLTGESAGGWDDAERWAWLAAGVLVAGGAAHAARTHRGRRPADRVTLGADSALARWEDGHAGTG